MKLFGRRTEANPSPVESDWLPAPGHNVLPPAKGFQLGFSFEAPADLIEQLSGFTSAKVSRRDALSVPAVLKARNMIAGIPATLPIRVHDKSLAIDDRNTVVTDPHREIPASVIYAMTFEDLLLEGRSYWRITRRSAEGFPVEAHHVNIRSIGQHAILGMPSEVLSDDLQFSPGDPIFIDGYPVSPREVIRFVSPNPPLLTHAARAIRSALLLDKVAALYAQDPLPLGYFTDQDATMSALDDTEVQDVLDKWATARRQRAYGYVPSGLKLETLQWDAEKIQLADARQHAVLEVARAAGVDPEDLGVSTTSRTYQNAEERRMDLIAFTLMPFLTAVEQRLSKDDVLPRGLHARFDTSEFLRADIKDRMEAYQVAVDIGAMTEDELRIAEHRPPLTAAQKAALKPPPPPALAPPDQQEQQPNDRLRIAS